VRHDRSAAAGRQVGAPVGANADHGSTSWRLVFRDDFDGPTVDPAWWPYDGPGHQGNGVRSPSAFTIENGVLVVTAQMVAGRLVSGGLYHSLGLRYGRFEFRVRTDPDPSGVTSGVVLTWPESDNWPADGENDIYETGTDPARTSFNSFVHYGADDATVSIGHPVPATQWHTMAMDWEPGAIRIYRDGSLTGTITDRTAIPDVAHHLCIQLDPYAPQMTGRARMYVDDVRIYAPT
jgi:beta-glucanase (GH16 family)